MCYTPWSVFQDGSVEAILTKSPEGPSSQAIYFAKKFGCPVTFPNVFPIAMTSFCLLDMKKKQSKLHDAPQANEVLRRTDALPLIPNVTSK